MRLRSTTIGLATLGVVLSGTTVLSGTALAATPTAGTPIAPAVSAACSPEGATQGTRQYGYLQTCKNGVWVTSKCPAGKPNVTYYAGPPPFVMCTPVGAH